jgi:predicted RNase H-like nuclease (RuvC/YqgF family)
MTNEEIANAARGWVHDLKPRLSTEEAYVACRSYECGYLAAQSHYEAKSVEREKTNTMLSTELVEQETKIAALEAEVLEQRRINGRGSERESRLMDRAIEQERRDAEKIAALEKRVERLRGALEELVDLMEDVRSGDYTPDSFTCDPARAALKQDEDKSE